MTPAPTSGRPASLSPWAATSPIPVGIEVDSTISGVELRSALTQPNPYPVSAHSAPYETAPPTVASRPVRRIGHQRRSRTSSSTANGSSTSEVALTARASPIRAPLPSARWAYRSPGSAPGMATASAAIIRPAINASLCAPDTAWISTSGLSRTNQAARTGSAPSATATRCPAQPTSPMPTSATRRNTQTAAVRLPVDAAPPEINSHSGPYGLGVGRHIGEICASQGHGRAETPWVYGSIPALTRLPWQAYA